MQTSASERLEICFIGPDTVVFCDPANVLDTRAKRILCHGPAEAQGYLDITEVVSYILSKQGTRNGHLIGNRQET